MILLTDLLTTALDEPGQGWTNSPSSTYTRRQCRRLWPYVDKPDLATDQKAGGSSPSERATSSQVSGHSSVVRGGPFGCQKAWPLTISHSSLGDLVNAGQRAAALVQVGIARVHVGALGECGVALSLGRPLGARRATCRWRPQIKSVHTARTLVGAWPSSSAVPLSGSRPPRRGRSLRSRRMRSASPNLDPAATRPGSAPIEDDGA
jgi:hypothetical protein